MELHYLSVSFCHFFFFLFLCCLCSFDGIGAVWCWCRRPYPQELSRVGQTYLGSHDHSPTELIEFWAVTSHENHGNTYSADGARGRPRTEPEWQTRHDTRHGCGRPHVRGLRQIQCSLALGQAGVSWAPTRIIFRSIADAGHFGSMVQSGAKVFLPLIFWLLLLLLANLFVSIL